MALTVNSNIASLNAQRNLNTNQGALSTALQRLSSGLRINSAKDDAAGLAISERFTAQIRGNDQAARNANDGISLAQTAEGDLDQIGTNLQRVRELAVQAANASNSDSDRASINNEVTQLLAEIDRVAANSSFNGTKLLDGSFASKTFQVGANSSVNDQISIASIASARTTALGGTGVTVEATRTSLATVAALATGDLTVNGQTVLASSAGLKDGQTAASAFSIAAAINNVGALSGVTATANLNSVTGATATVFTAIAADTFSINGTNVGAVVAGVNAAGQGANLAYAINQISAASGVTAVADATTGALTLTAVDGRDINIGLGGTAADAVAAAANKATFLTQTGLATGVVGSKAVSGTTTVASGAYTTATSVIKTSTVASGAFTAATSATATDAFNLSIDGIAVFGDAAVVGTGTSSGVVGAGGIAAAAVDTAINTWLGVNTGYTKTGSAAAGTLQINKLDGTAITIARSFTDGAGGAAVGATAGGTFATAAFTGPTVAAAQTDAFNMTIDGIAVFGDAAVAGTGTSSGVLGIGGDVTAAEVDTALTTWLGVNTGYTKTGTAAAGTLQITKTDGTAITIARSFTNGAGAAAAGASTGGTFATAAFTGPTAAQLAAAAGAANHGTVTLKSSSAAGIVLGGATATNAGLTVGTTAATSNAYIKAISSIDVLTAANATSALSAIDGALSTIATTRGALGAYQNRFESTVASLQTTNENLTASRSRIRDADFAKETAALSRAQVLQQAGTAILAQANQSSQGVLSLLR